jgi:dipeptidyl aminopeptidase/acylaminoacyl peptidase
LADFTTDPATLTVIDPATGNAQTTFTAPGLTQSSEQWAAGNYLFYLDSSSQMARRAAFDGTTLDLPFVNPGGNFFEGQILPSPDGERIAWGTTAFEPDPAGDTHIQVTVANVDGTGEQILLDKRLAASILPQPVQWSRDGRYLYFTDEPYGIGGYILFWGGPDLQQVDLATGTITEVLPDQGCLCAMSLSPDGTLLAVITGVGPLELVLRDLATGTERKTVLEDGHWQAGNIVWSPDGKALMYTMAIGDPEKEAYSIVRVDAGTLAQTVLIHDDTRLLETVVWADAKTVWLNITLKVGGAWRMDADTGDTALVAEGQVVIEVAR